MAEGATSSIPFVSLEPQHQFLSQALQCATQRVLASGRFIQGEHCTLFESRFADYLGVEHAAGCASGLDALELIFMALDLGPGDEVIVPAHTFIATALAVSRTGATPVFCDVEPDYFALDPDRLEAAITSHTRAIVVVHLYGQVGRFAELQAIADRHGIPIIEDAAQAHGACYRGKRAGSLGLAAGFSFYPTKNLGALGDGGCIVTNDEALDRRIRLVANYGSRVKYCHEEKGINSRLDELQAAYLLEKLPYLDRWNQDRSALAGQYLQKISNPLVQLPQINPEGEPVWYVFPVFCQERDALAAYLQARGIGTLIHYPTPMHLHPAYRELGYGPGDFPVAERLCQTELGLPLYWGLSHDQQEAVIQAVNTYDGRNEDK